MFAWIRSLFRKLSTAPVAVRGEAAPAPVLDHDPELVEAFLAEFADILPAIQRNFATWRANTADTDTLKQLRRGFHTIKGSAPIVGATALGVFGRDLERLTITFHERPETITPDALKILEQAIGMLPAYAETVRTNKPPPTLARILGQRLRRLAE